MPEKKRGRPPLSPEEKAAKDAQRKANANAYHKKTGWAAQKKYKASHPEKYGAGVYEPKVRIPMAYKQELVNLMSHTGLTITQLFVGAVEEKYGIILHHTVDNHKE